MSHFPVMVIGDDVHEQLAPVQENNMGDCPKSFLEFNDLEETYYAKYNEEGTHVVIIPREIAMRACVDPDFIGMREPGNPGWKDDLYGYISKTNDGKFWAFARDHAFSVKVQSEKGYSKAEWEYPDWATPEHRAYKDLFPTMEKYVDIIHGGERDKEKGRYGYWENPDARWDYYQIGGRWAGYWRLKKGVTGDHLHKTDPSWTMKDVDPGYYNGRASSARKKDIDFEEMYHEAYKNAIEAWEESKKRVKEGDIKQDVVEFLYGIKKDDTIESYKQRRQNAAITTFALLYEGQWYERGVMGWFGVSSDEGDEDACEKWDKKFHELLEELPDDTLLTIVDCHI